MQALLEEFDEYLALQRDRSAHTRRAYLGDLRSLFEFTGGGLETLTLPRLRSWLAAQAGAGAARTTLARRTSAIKTFTAWALHRGLLTSDPAARLQTPRRIARCPRCCARTRPSTRWTPSIPVRSKGTRSRCGTG